MRSGWTTQAQLLFSCTRKDGRTLAVSLAPAFGLLNQWQMVAFETGSIDGLQAILDDHAHHDAGVFVTLIEGIAAAEKLAKKWQRKGLASEACVCDEIGKAAAE